MNDAIVHFTLGTSPLLFLVPYFMIGNAYSQLTEDEKEDSMISFTTLVIGLPIVFGLVFALVYNYLGFIPRKQSKQLYLRFVFSGALAALLVSLLLHYVFHIQDDWMQVENTAMFHGAVFIGYLVYFYTVGQWIRYQVLYGPPSSSSSSSSSGKSKSSSSSSTRSSSSSSSSNFDDLKKLLKQKQDD